MEQPKRYLRSNSTITISVFYEQYQLNKYNFNPNYQRKSGIWKKKDKEFLIDTIFKNFPMPPIFCEQIIENGITTYDIIDGKQRLSSIVDFINNKISLPSDFSNDEYGYGLLNGRRMNEIIEMAHGNGILPPDPIAEAFLDTFWSYKINVEYIEKPDAKIVKGIFDRLNRNGERLNSAELRNARYCDSAVYQQISSLAARDEICEIVPQNIRQRNINFWTEVFIFTFTGNILPGNASCIDKQVELLTAESPESIEIIEKNVLSTIEVYKEWNIDLVKYKISKEVHLYTLMYLAHVVFNKELQIENLVQKLNAFFTELRAEGPSSKNINVVEYYDSTQSGSKSLKQREKRYSALKKYLLQY